MSMTITYGGEIVKDSILSFEFMNPDGSMREQRELSPKNRERRVEVETKIRERKALDRPIIGIGLMDNVEIGSGRYRFALLRRCTSVKHKRKISKTILCRYLK